MLSGTLSIRNKTAWPIGQSFTLPLLPGKLIMKQNRFWFRPLFFLLSLWLTAFSVAAEIPFASGLLFRVQSGDTAANYIFGTMHTDDHRVRKLVSRMTWAFNASATLAVEVELDELTRVAAVSQMVSPVARDLREILGDRLYDRALTEANRLGLPQVTMNQYKPWALAVLFSLPPTEGGQIPEQILSEMALRQGKPVIGLETVEEQLGAFDSLPTADQNAMLKHALNNLDQSPMVYRELLKSYLAGDLKGLLRISRDNFGTEDQGWIGRFQEAIIYGRNRRMASRLMGPLRKGGVFAAVGALHLPGEQGVLNTLRSRGFRVEVVY